MIYCSYLLYQQKLYKIIGILLYKEFSYLRSGELNTCFHEGWDVDLYAGFCIRQRKPIFKRSCIRIPNIGQGSNGKENEIDTMAYSLLTRLYYVNEACIYFKNITKTTQLFSGKRISFANFTHFRVSKVGNESHIPC